MVVKNKSDQMHTNAGEAYKWITKLVLKYKPLYALTMNFIG